MTHMEKAQELRARTDVHFNCCQSVLVAFAQDMGLTEEQAFSLGANFGSGMRCGAACGALTGGLMVLGMTNYPPGIPRTEHCDGLVFDVVQMLE